MNEFKHEVTYSRSITYFQKSKIYKINIFCHSILSDILEKIAYMQFNFVTPYVILHSILFIFINK
jgi:hypothetical protein